MVMPHNPTGSDERLVALETALAYQQRLCEQLNQIVCEHSQQLLAMQRTVKELSGRLQDIHVQRKEAMLDPQDEKPPHY
jgi:uncharacterized coiled-coil protein SlyX